ncbi:MAG TPA: TlpA disulfide reductase family protein [Burkholderiales bacterium]|nr:TlpA disulfide reductase family protein [Burkholderiales bacterium]
MTPSGKHLLVVAAVAVSGVIGFLVSRSLEEGDRKAPATAAPAQKPPAAAPDEGGAALLAAAWPDLNGVNQPLSQWKGKVLVVNFWATWCEPCKKEIPEFVKVQAKFLDKGVVFVGIALDEKDKVAAMSRELGINYPVLIAPLSAIDVSKAAGNRMSALPFTAILDRDGRVVLGKLGGLDEAGLIQAISPLI